MHPAVKALITRPRLVRPDLDLTPGLRMTTDGAASFAAASSQSLSIASNASLQGGDVSLWGCAWVNLTTKPANQMFAFGKWTAAGNLREYVLVWDNATDRFQFVVSNDGTNVVVLSADTFGAPSTGTWYFIFWYHDPVANTIGISVNGAFDTASHTTGVFAGASAFVIGARGDGDRFWNGPLDAVAFGKNVVGGFAATSAATIEAAMRNSGNGLAAKDLTHAQRTAWGVVSGWDFDGPSGNLVKDYIGANTLTNNAGVTYAAGKVVSSQLTDADAVASWFDPYGGTTWSQATAASRPLYKANILNGYPVVRGDGTNDFLSGGTKALDLARKTAGFTMLAVVKYGKAATAELPAWLSINGTATSIRAGIGDEGSGDYSPEAGGRNTDGGSAVVATATVAKDTSNFVAVASLLNFSGGPVRTRLNGTQYGSSSFASPASTPDTASAVANLFANGTPSNHLQGDIARLLCWRRVLRTDEIRRWERHLGRQYGIAVAG